MESVGNTLTPEARQALGRAYALLLRWANENETVEGDDACRPVPSTAVDTPTKAGRARGIVHQ
ncbi:MAG: hypothetical protein ACOYZ7_20415 [Chloroflexota bacterium]